MVGVVGVAVAGVWAQAGSGIDVNLLRAFNDLTSNITTLGKAVYGVGSIWVVVATVVALVLFGHRSVAARALLAGASAWGIAVLLNHLLGHHDLAGVSIHVRAGGGPVFPASNVAVVTALVITLGPFLVRPARRALHVLVVAVAVAALYLGVGFPSDVVGGLLVGRRDVGRGARRAGLAGGAPLDRRALRGARRPGPRRRRRPLRGRPRRAGHRGRGPDRLG